MSDSLSIIMINRSTSLAAKRVGADVPASDEDSACGECEGKQCKRAKYNSAEHIQPLGEDHSCCIGVSSDKEEMKRVGEARNSEALLAGQGAACSARRVFDDAGTHSSNDDFTGASYPGRTPNSKHSLSEASVTGLRFSGASATGLRLSGGSHALFHSAKSPTLEFTGYLHCSPNAFVAESLGATNSLQECTKHSAPQLASTASCSQPPPAPTLLRKVGEGTFGRVFECVWRGKRCAVKIKALEDDVDVEVNVLKRLACNTRHPGILRLLGWGMQLQAKRMFLHFPLAPMSLRDLIEQHRSMQIFFSQNQKRNLLFGLTSATSYMHSHSVLHRDMKPGNILVKQEAEKKTMAGSVPPVANSAYPLCPDSSSAALWMPIIADFGNSCMLDSTVALPTRRFCTLQYAAPEVLLRQMPYSYPSDIWSLGAILFEIEHLRAAFPVRGDVGECELSQILQIWKSCAASSTIAQGRSQFEIAIQRELQSRLPACVLSKADERSLTRPIAGAPYGYQYSAFVRRCLRMEPFFRPRSKELIML
jgi:serine/threonine protein kinase